jgi:paraquat-inducible protein A
VTCHSKIERVMGCSQTAALALSIAALALLIPANLMPFLTTSILGASRESLLATSSTAMVANGYPLLAIAIGLFVVVLPFIRFALLVCVLGALHKNRHPPWLGRAFRWACELQTWSMPDVFLLGLAVAYARLKASIDVEVGLGAYCFIAVGILALLVRATLDRARVWRAIYPDPTHEKREPLMTCPGCEMVLPLSMDGQHCPRCAARLHRRKPENMGRALALTLAGALLYFPANIYPIATIPVGLSSLSYNILGGAIELLQNNLYALAALVIVASFAIPLLKLVGLTWCIASVKRRSSKWLRQKTWVYRVVEEIGRWSMVDPFVIACFVPVSSYSSLVRGHAEPAAQAFTAVVIITIFAARCFDPRTMWDRARKVS